MENNKQNTLLLTVISVATLLVAVIGATFAYFTANVNDTETSAVILTTATLTINYEGGTNGLVTNSTSVEPTDPNGDHPLISKQFTLTAQTNNTNTASKTGDEVNMPYVVQLVVTKNTFHLTNALSSDTNYANTSLSYKLTTSSSDTGAIPSNSTKYGALPQTELPGATDIQKNDARTTAATKDEMQTGVMGDIRVYQASGYYNDVQGINLGRGVFKRDGGATSHAYTLKVYFLNDGKVQDADEEKEFQAYIAISTGDPKTQLTNNTDVQGVNCVLDENHCSTIITQAA